MGFFKSLFEKKVDPETIKYPAVNKNYETNVKGLYIIGELSGIPLFKTALSSGVDIIEKIKDVLQTRPSNISDDVFDLLIVGFGASGFSTANECNKLGIKYIALEKEKLFTTLQKFAKGKIILAEPLNMENKSDIWLEECTKEELLEKWLSKVNKENYNVKTKMTVHNVKKKDGIFHVNTEEGPSFKARKVILASGKAGNPRKIGIEGENLQKVAHFLDDPVNYTGKNIHIYGGGDVSVECALMLADNNNVTLSTINEKWIYPKKRNQDLINDKIEQGKVTVNFETEVKQITENSVIIRNRKTKETQTIDNDYAFTMIGAELPIPFFKRLGIKLENQWDLTRWMKLIIGLSVAFIIYAFAWKAPPFHKSGEWLMKLFPNIKPTEWGWFLRDTFFWYSALYTVSMLLFGTIAAIRWGKGKGKKYAYQRWRYTSLIFFQTFFFFILPYFIVPRATSSYSFRLFYAWPLKYDAFFGANIFWVIYPIVLTLIIIPIFTYFHGKRYCTWICACGGLAETVGDRWRHLSPKGNKARKWEFMGLWILLYTLFVALWVILLGEQATPGWVNWSGSNGMYAWYLFLTVFGLTSVIPVGVYPVLGGKIWCRYWCPLAKLMEYISKFFAKKKKSKYKIKSYDHCILCNECSKYCEVGINVMGFARNEEAFDNANSSCIGCGICVTVCPVDNLGFDTWKENMIYKGKPH